MGDFPYKFHPHPNNANLRRDFLGYSESGLVVSEPDGYVFGAPFEHQAKRIFHMELRDDDVWVVSYPKSGTTWMQHLVWLLLNNLDFDNKERVDFRSPFVDFDQCTPKAKFEKELTEKKEECLRSANPDLDFLKVLDVELNFLKLNMVQVADDCPRTKPRCLKSHLPFSFLPPDVLKRNKTIYVARDPRDVVVSYFHHHRLIRHHEYIGDFKKFFKYFINEEVIWSPFWQHIAQAWSQRDNENVLFVCFSDMKKDLRSVIDRVCQFINVSYSEEDIGRLMEHLDIENMRNNEAVNDTDIMVRLGMFKENEGSFVRKGASGGWKNWLDEEMIKEMEEWKEKNSKKFPLPLDKLWK